MSVTMKNTVFCGVTLRGLVSTYKNLVDPVISITRVEEQTQKTEGRFLQNSGSFLPGYRAEHLKTIKGHHIANASHNCDKTIAKFFTQGFTVTWLHPAESF